MRWLCLAFASALMSLLVASSIAHGAQNAAQTAAQRKPLTFVDEQQCASCHAQQMHDWHGSHHDKAMDHATADTVLGDFNHAHFTHRGVTTTFYKKGKQFFVRTDGKDGKLHDYPVRYVFGFTPLQQYLIPFPDGRLQALDIAWDSRPEAAGGQRWFHLHPDEPITAKHPFHWTRRFLNWNYMCASCHSTNVNKHFDLKQNRFRTTWSKIDVGCQACHGPASRHLQWATAKKQPVWPQHGFPVDLAAADSHIQIETCARCHARRSIVSNDYRHGQPFMDFFKPQLLREPFYHPDGQIKDEDYVYGSFVQSKMYAAGVRCTDCHNAHTARLRLRGNNLCISCHSSAPNPRFSMLKRKAYDAPAHHHHKMGSRGAQCISCHMPSKIYMGVDRRRDHSFRIPRPDLSAQIGTPNACTQCHTDKSATWAAVAFHRWFPDAAATHARQSQFATTFAHAQQHAQQTSQPNTAASLRQIAADRGQPIIVRATAVSLLAGYPSRATLDALQPLLQHTDPLIRYHAIRSLDRLLPPAAGAAMQQRKVRMIAPLLDDPIRAVRSEAARALSDVPQKLLTADQRQSFQRAADDYLARQQAIAERPEAHLNRGLFYQRQGEFQQAETAYQTAIRLVPDDLPARFNLANLYHLQGKNRQAEARFREIIAIDPKNGEAYYSLGLLLAELKRLPEAVTALQQAVRYLPKRPRVRYNYALTLKKLGSDEAALDALQQAVTPQTRDAMMVYVLTTWLAQAKRYTEALPWAERLVQLAPHEPGARRLRDAIAHHLRNPR